MQDTPGVTMPVPPRVGDEQSTAARLPDPGTAVQGGTEDNAAATASATPKEGATVPTPLVQSLNIEPSYTKDGKLTAGIPAHELRKAPPPFAANLPT